MSEYTNQIMKIDGKGTFLEVTSDMMPMGKLLFHFCTYNENNVMTCMLPFYLSEEESIALAIRLSDERLKKDGVETYYEKSGGSDRIQSLKKWCPWLKDGMHVARRFKIQNSTKYEYLFKVEYGIGHKEGNLSVMDEIKRYIQIPLSKDAAIALGEKILMSWQAFYNLTYFKFQEELFPEYSSHLFIPDPTKEKKKEIDFSHYEKKKDDLCDQFLIIGKVESGELKSGEFWYKVPVKLIRSNETGNLVFYPNQIKKVEDRFEKALRWISENPSEKCILPVIYSIGAKGGFIFKNFATTEGNYGNIS